MGTADEQSESESRRGAHRRDFLTGRAATDALADWAVRRAEEVAGSGGTASMPAAPLESPAAPVETYLVEISRRAMACQFQIGLNAGQHAAGTEAAIAALDLVELLEAQLSIYRADSELSTINRTASHAAVPVEARLFTLLQESVLLYRETGGAFDITAGPLIKAWGFFQRQGAIPDAEALAAARQSAGSQYLELGAHDHTVRFERSGMEINLGAIGKGYALDRAAEVLAAHNVADYLMHGGQSSVLARGSQAGGTSDGWVIGVLDPTRPQRRVAQITLRDRALGTSGSATQFFRDQGQRFGHILDPRSGQPASRVLSATVVAPTAAMADALATAFYVLGPEESFAIAEKRGDVAALLILPASHGRIEFAQFGFDDRALVMSE